MSNKGQIIYGYKSKKQTKIEERKVEFVISTERKDRHGDVVMVNGWELTDYNRNGIVAYQHLTWGSDPDNIIGKGKAWIDGDRLMGEVEFEPKEINEKAEKIFQKVLNGTLSATSVGFMPKAGHWGDETKGEDKNAFYIEKAELLEFSIVNIPANADAILSKDIDNDGLQELKQATKKIEETQKENGGKRRAAIVKYHKLNSN